MIHVVRLLAYVVAGLCLVYIFACGESTPYCWFEDDEQYCEVDGRSYEIYAGPEYDDDVQPAHY